MGGLETALWAFFGGTGAEAVSFWAIRHSRPHEFPHWVRSPSYYLIAIGMAAIGGALALAHARSGADVTPWLAIHIGAATPLILRKLRDAVPGAQDDVDQARVD